MSIHRIQQIWEHSDPRWVDFLTTLHACLQDVEVSARNAEPLTAHDGFSRWEEQAVRVKEGGHVVFFVGNGASCTLCSHFAADIGKNARFKTQIFTDASLMSALGNDISFDQIYAEPLRRNARSGDMLIAVSSSGNSPNIVAAVAAAREIGMWILTLTGKSSGNVMRSMGDLNFWVKADAYGIVETAHTAILHHWTDRLVARNGG